MTGKLGNGRLHIGLDLEPQSLSSGFIPELLDQMVGGEGK